MASLPPLNALRAFISAAKHGSFKKAADDLRVTPGAVSRQIQVLEDFFGFPLFQRGSQTVTLNAKGNYYFTRVKTFFTDLQSASHTLLSSSQTTPIIIDCGPSFSNNWLFVKLNAFHRLYPNINITLRSYNGPVQNDFDYAIRVNPENFAGYPSVELFTEYSAPVCSPLFEGLKKINSANDLYKTKTIHAHYRKDLWPIWISALNLDSARLKDILTVDYMFMAIQAAENNLGVTVAPLHYIQQQLNDSKLITLFNTPPVKSATYYLVSSHNTRTHDMQLFHDWLINISSSENHNTY